MKILHFSDTHLGYSDLDKMTPNGVNLREQDFYDSFVHVIDQAIERKPGLILHSGDFFHRPSPTNRAMTFALEQLRRLEEAQIPISIIAGNHETPKTIFTSPILKAFRNFKNIYPIFGQTYETQEFGDLVVHGLPHINDPKVLLAEMDQIQPVEGKFNILMLHTSIGKDYLMEEYGEQLFPPERLDLLNRFDYVALGHWHNFQQVKLLNTAWYVGSTERMSETEIGKPKGYCWLELEKGSSIEPRFIEIPSRDWHKVVIKKCEEKSVEEITDLLKIKATEIDLDNSLLSLIFQDISSSQAMQLNNRMLRELIQGPVHINIKRQFAHLENSQLALEHKTESLDTLLKSFIKTEVDEKQKADRLSEKAIHYFHLFESGEYKKR